MATRDIPEQARILPPGVDDFTVINGIKNGIEKRLHTAGITTYAQLAALTPEEIIAKIGPLVGLTKERIVHQDWTGQAYDLAEQHHQIQPETMDDDEDRQHYVSFTVEFLLDEQNQVRRTRVKEVLSGGETAWAGWDGQKLVDCLVQEGALRVEPEPVEPETVEPETVEPEPVETAQPIELEQPSKPETGCLEILGIAIQSNNGRSSKNARSVNQPFHLGLRLAMRDVQPGVTGLECTASVKAKKLGSGERIVLGEWRGVLENQEAFDLEFTAPGLPAGLYRLEADAAVIYQIKQEAGLSASLEGNLLQVI